MRLRPESAAGCWAVAAVLALGWAGIDASAQSAGESGQTIVRDSGETDAAGTSAAAAGGPADPWATLPPDFDAPVFSEEELERLVAPIALFPDVLLAQILLAATYPLDVVRADRWVRSNADLAGEELFAALEAQNWDPSVMALTGFPPVLQRMAEDLDWTEALGDALITQDQDLLDAIQRLRAMAQAAGFLASGEQMTVSFEDDAILIDPTDPDVIFVPLYDSDILFEAARAGAYAGAREGVAAEFGTGAPAAATGSAPAPASAPAPVVVVVEQAAPTTVVVDRGGHSSAALATTGLFGFATGVAVGSLWNNNRWYRTSWHGSNRVHHHHHVHWRGGGIYRPPVLRPGPGPRPGHRPGLRPDDRWRPHPDDRVRRRAEIIREREAVRRPGSGGARPPARPPSGAAPDRDAIRDRLADRGRAPAADRDRLRDVAASRPQVPVRRPGDAPSIRPDRPGDAARPRAPQRDSALGGQRSITDAARDRERGRQSLERPGSGQGGGGASRDAARERLQQRAAPQRQSQPERPQRPAAVPQRPSQQQRPAAVPQRPSQQQRPAAVPQRPSQQQRPAAVPQRPAQPAQRRQAQPTRGGGLDVQRARDARQDRSRGQNSRQISDRRPQR